MTLAELLEKHRSALVAYVARHGGRILRFETADDIAQGICLRLLERPDAFDYEGEKQFLSWMYAATKNFLANRHAYWLAVRRRPSALLTLTTHGPAATATGPPTFAERREALGLAYEALAVLLDRDRQLVLWTAEDVPLRTIGERLGLSYSAVERARARAIERFRQAYELARRGR